MTVSRMNCWARCRLAPGSCHRCYGGVSDSTPEWPKNQEEAGPDGYGSSTDNRGRWDEWLGTSKYGLTRPCPVPGSVG